MNYLVVGAGNASRPVARLLNYLGHSVVITDLKDISEFMNLKVQENEIKLVIATPHPKKIVKYINECEIVFVTPYTDVYGTRLIGLGNTQIFESPYEQTKKW